MMEPEYGFQAPDYVVCCVVIAISISIGLYYAFSGGRQSTTLEFHLGNRNLNVFPVMLSLMVTSQSSILLIGVPAEVYIYGIMGMWGGLGFTIAYLLASRILIPLVYPLKITSVNEYFERRYKTRYVRFFMTFLGNFFWIIYLGIITYGISVAIESVVGVPVWISIIVVSGSSMIYVSLGGIKAVVWTDVFQYSIMVLSIFAVIIKGSLDAGGGSNVWNVNTKTRRLQSFEFSTDLTLRYTVWNVLIGASIKLLAFPLTQAAVQRIGCMPTIKDAYRMFYLVGPFICVTFIFSAVQGFVAYAYFDHLGCDPVESKMIKNLNQIIPHMVVRLFYYYPGLSGVFISGLFCATMSTISSGFSAMSAMALEDVFKAKFKNLTEFQGTVISKVSVVVFSVITTAMAFLMANVKGTLIQLASVLLAIPMAPYTGVFLYSIFCESATTAGAISGGVASLLFYLWISLGQTFSNIPKISKKLAPGSIDMCPSTIGNISSLSSFSNVSSLSSFSNVSSISNVSSVSYNIYHQTTTSVPVTQPPFQPEGITKFYTLSFQWFDTVAIFIAISVGLIVSLIVGRPKSTDIDPRYMLSFTEQFFPFLPKKVKYYMSFGSDLAERREKLLKEDRIKREEVEIFIDAPLESKEQIALNGNQRDSEKSQYRD